MTCNPAARPNLERLRPDLGQLRLLRLSRVRWRRPLQPGLMTRILLGPTGRVTVAGCQRRGKTGKELQALDCTLLAHALRHPARSGLESVQVMWLQNNRIDACGLEALARGLRAMPEGCRLKSIALGGNAFHATIKEAGAGAKLPRSLRRALRELENAATERKVGIRLHS